MRRHSFSAIEDSFFLQRRDEYDERLENVILSLGKDVEFEDADDLEKTLNEDSRVVYECNLPTTSDTDSSHAICKKSKFDAVYNHALVLPLGTVSKFERKENNWQRKLESFTTIDKLASFKIF